MKISKHLIDWLHRNAVYMGSVRLNNTDDMRFVAMLTECRMLNLIEFDTMDEAVIEYRLTAIGEIALGIQDPATEPLATPPTGTREAGYVQAIGVLHNRIAVMAEAIRNARIELFRARAWNTDAYKFLATVDAEPITENMFDKPPATPPTESVGTGDGEREWELVSMGTETPRVYDNEFDFNLDSYSEALNLLGVLRDYETETAALRSELAAARERIAELTGERDAMNARYEGKHERLHYFLSLSTKLQNKLDRVRRDLPINGIGSALEILDEPIEVDE